MLVGRAAEQAAIRTVLESASGGYGGSLLIRGVAGSGKSALLADAVDCASDMRVLRTQGVESESPLAFAALQRLLWPLRRRVAELPAPQAAALGVALGESEGDGERFLAFLGVLSLLADAAEEQAVLVAIDDAQWLDEASAAAMLFVARRLQAERVAVLFTARDGEPSRFFDAPDLPMVALGGMAGEDATALLVRDGMSPDSVDPAVRDRLVDATAGNALALVELAAALTPEQLSGTAALPAELPVTGGVERAFGDRYRRLSGPAQTFMLVVAADDTGRSLTVRDAAERLGAGDAALDEAEQGGLVRLQGPSVTLHHPLVRSAVYRAATSAQRRAAHRVLAEALDADPDRRAWHLAAAINRPDETVVAELDAAAQRAADRGGHESAAAAWSRAAELTEAREPRGRRLFFAASSAWLGGQPSRATALARAAGNDVTDAGLRAQLLVLQAQIEWNTHSLNEGYDLVVQATQIAAGVDDAMAQQLAMLAASLAAFGARSPRPFDPATLVVEPTSDTPSRVRAAFHLLHGFRAVAADDYANAAEAFGKAFALTDADPVEDHVLQPNLGMAAWLIDDDERTLRLHDDQLSIARRTSALNMVEHALTRGFHPQLVIGQWTAAGAAAAEALRLSASTGHIGLTALPTAELALIAALRGDDATAQDYLADVTTIRESHPIGITDVLVQDLTRWAGALKTDIPPASALLQLNQLQLPVLRRAAALDAYDLAVRGEHTDVLQTWVDEMAEFASATSTPPAVAVAEHGRALLADEERAGEHFQHALTAHAASPRMPDRARTELAYGAHLRRARRRVEARNHLRAALTLFEQLGAVPMANRAAQELRASGETARRRQTATANELTAQERQVAALVRQGLSNKDAAAQLFLSPRTVDFHLRNVYQKLGLTSRAELAATTLG